MLRQRSISAIAIIIVAAVPGFIGGYVFVAAMTVLALAGVYEFTRVLSARGYRPFTSIALVWIVLLMVLTATSAPGWSYLSSITGLVLVTLAADVFRRTLAGALAEWGFTVAATLYVGLPLAHGILLRNLDGASDRGWVNSLADFTGSPDTAAGLAWFGLALSATWLTDTAAYLVGRSFGTTKLIPEVSPGKTRVGAAAGLAAGTLTGIVATLVFGVPIHFLLGGTIGLALGFAGQLGDLGESIIKRNLGVKDMGNLIPGHGGILDRIDALLFTLPLTYILARLCQEVGLV